MSSQEMRDADHKLFERGRGNVCSVEESTVVCMSRLLTDVATVVQLFVPVARNDFRS
jgi:hypothetical protein